ncbi:O-antigen ligase family protein [Bradyrhizobium sp. BWA-3-5]|uniref:O-antigen ligase family protein n=1 Tax=Bradyrhizobium sp. BWA-3-5 TaxID=3080013 RepID=UPI00293E57F3|nr:O-antigen ligase family protein [Bradyrhizobium sp. BWA-3-5]WOH69781.1 O-antigen ligase family protein [Bradyrhizobium sp. BWA-3-5]
MLSVMASARHDPFARMLNVDLMAVLVTALLPWSTSGVGIGMLVWLAALTATLELRPFLNSLLRPINVLPIALVALAAIGMLWSDASWGARLYAVSPATKLLFLPFLLYHFERSTRGLWVFIAFLASCTLMTVASWIVAIEPSLSLKGTGDPATYGIFTKNYIDQSQEFVLCTVVLALPIIISLRDGKIRLALLLTAVATNFIVNMAFVVVSRTALVTLPVMLAVFAMAHLRWKTNVLLSVAAVALGALAWTVSPHLQKTTDRFTRDYRLYKELNEPTSIGLRLEFWEKSLRFFAEAPIIGHGTGSTRGLFEAAATGPAGSAQGQVIGNPHNQTLNVAVQWGMVGVIILYTMWFAHFSLFRGEGLAAWIGLMVVLQNIFSSLFNSHLFDFHEGWMYVLGVGVAGGMVLRGAARHTDSSGTAAP